MISKVLLSTFQSYTDVKPQFPGNPGFFCDFFGLEASFFHNEKKNTSGAAMTTKMKRIWPSYWAAPCKLIFIKSNLLKKMSSNAPRFDAGYLQRFARIFWARHVVKTCLLKKKRKQALTSRIFNYMSCTKTHGISTWWWFGDPRTLLYRV